LDHVQSIAVRRQSHTEDCALGGWVRQPRSILGTRYCAHLNTEMPPDPPAAYSVDPSGDNQNARYRYCTLVKCFTNVGVAGFVVSMTVHLGSGTHVNPVTGRVGWQRRVCGLLPNVGISREHRRGRRWPTTAKSLFSVGYGLRHVGRNLPSGLSTTSRDTCVGTAPILGGRTSYQRSPGPKRPAPVAT